MVIKMELQERIKELEKCEGLTREDLAKKIGLKYTRLRNIVGGQTLPRIDDLEAIAKVFPEYEYWIFTGKELAEAGQISPLTKKAHRDYGESGTASQSQKKQLFTYT